MTTDTGTKTTNAKMAMMRKAVTILALALALASPACFAQGDADAMAAPADAPEPVAASEPERVASYIPRSSPLYDNLMNNKEHFHCPDGECVFTLGDVRFERPMPNTNDRHDATRRSHDTHARNID